MKIDTKSLVLTAVDFNTIVPFSLILVPKSAEKIVLNLVPKLQFGIKITAVYTKKIRNSQKKKDAVVPMVLNDNKYFTVKDHAAEKAKNSEVKKSHFEHTDKSLAIAEMGDRLNALFDILEQSADSA